MRRTLWAWLIAIVVVILLAYTPPVRAAGRGFFSSLRIAKPKPVSASLTAPAPGSARQMQDAVTGMVTSTPATTLDEPARDAPTPDSASKRAGFAVRLVAARQDKPSLTVIGARRIEAGVDRDALRTILDEAGDKHVATPASLQGGVLRVSAPRAIRAEYGHCPAPAANTIQGQLQGPPPPSTDYGDCVILMESPPARVDAPNGLDLHTLVEIALELSGMSPNQTSAFQQRVAPTAALALSLPRFMRSYDTVAVNGAPAMLLNTAGRRGPTYALVWAKDGLVYQLSGYGNPGDAVALANSVR
ncbi:MAG TPA: hypothetical protein VHB25_07775 [Gemmatimonadaceae bacterium]|nr:hypothetical protein [Gemmatimonadaceae bacterium]